MPTPVVSGTVSRLRAGLRVQPGPTQVRVGAQPRSTNDEVRLAWPAGLKAFQSFSDLEKGRHPSCITLARQEPKFKSFQFSRGALAGQSEIATGHRWRGREKAFSPIGSSQLVISAGAPCSGAARRIQTWRGFYRPPEIRCHLEKYRGNLGPPEYAAQKDCASMADIGRPKR